MTEINVGYSVLIFIVIAVLTFGARLFPFAIFGRGGKTPAIVSYIGNILPPAVMVLLVVYCLKNTEVMAWPHGIPEAISVAAVAVLYKLTKNNLVAIVPGTVLYIFLSQVVFT